MYIGGAYLPLGHHAPTPFLDPPLRLHSNSAWSNIRPPFHGPGFPSGPVRFAGSKNPTSENLFCRFHGPIYGGFPLAARVNNLLTSPYYTYYTY